METELHQRKVHVIMLLDSHESHISITAIEYEICIFSLCAHVSFPPHCSHKYNHSIEPFLVPSRYTTINLVIISNSMCIHRIAGCVGIAFPDALSPSDIQTGYRIECFDPVNTDAVVAVCLQRPMDGLGLLQFSYHFWTFRMLYYFLQGLTSDLITMSCSNLRQRLTDHFQRSPEMWKFLIIDSFHAHPETQQFQ